MNTKTKFDFWDVLKDEVSGFTGICQGITHYATGCIHYGLAPMKLEKDGKVGDWNWFDESRMILVKKSRRLAEKVPHSGPDMNPACK